MERRLSATQRVRVSLDQVAFLLEERPEICSGLVSSPVGRREERRIDVGATLGRGWSLHQEVVLSLRAADPPAPGQRRWQIVWQPPGGGRLVPSFRGTLDATVDGEGTRLRLAGSYRPPLGPVGAVGDGLIGHRIARQTVAAFLSGLAGRIDREASRPALATFKPAPYPENLRDRPLPADAWRG